MDVNVPTANLPLRVYIPYAIANDADSVQKIVNWCEQQFGIGSKNTLGGFFCSAESQWSINITIFDTVFFEFRTQQQLDWFTIRWM